MSSMTEQIVDDVAKEHQSLGLSETRFRKETDARGGPHGLNEFTRLEKMLLFAVVSECSRCIRAEGHDCFDFHKAVGCPFVKVREEYSVIDIIEWRERVQ